MIAPLETRDRPVTEPSYPYTLSLIACFSRRLIRSAKDLWRMAEPHAYIACCLLFEFALFYAKVTSAGSPIPPARRQAGHIFDSKPSRALVLRSQAFPL